MHSVTVLNVLQLRELSVSVAFVDVKEVKMENASLLGKCEELKRVVEKKSDGVVIGGTPKKYGTKEIFPAIIPLLFGSGISPAWGSYLPMPRH